MNETQARAFLKALGAQHIDTKASGKWLRCGCPLSRWTHKNHKDTNPSFGLTLSDYDPANFHCFSCASGSAEELLQTLEFYVANTPDLKPFYDFKTARQIVQNQELLMHVLPEFAEFTGSDSKRQPFKEWPKYFLDSFPSVLKVPEATEYMIGSKDDLNAYGQKCRGYTEFEVDHFDLRYDYGKKMIVFPYRNAYGRLAGMRGRAIDGGQSNVVGGVPLKHHDYTWSQVNNAGLVWFNEQVLQLPGWVVVVEGQIDAMRIHMGYEKVVANLTAKPTDEKLVKLLSADGVILIPDTDSTGEASVARYQAYMNRYKHPFKILRLPAEVKDPDDCHHAFLADLIAEII